MKPKVLFIGCVDFSRRLLERVLENGLVSVCGVITKRCSPFNSDHCDLTALADGAGVPCSYTEKGAEVDILGYLGEFKPDAIYCFGWSHLLAPSVLTSTPMGCIGYHPALLPHNRGRHPIIWALALGLAETGSTFFRMDEGADTGDILSQRIVPISQEDDALSLYDKLSGAAEDQIRELDMMLVAGALRGVPQKATDGNSWRKRTKHDGWIDFRMPSAGIRNLVRALRPPYPGAYVRFAGEEHVVGRVVIPEAYPQKIDNVEPGKILGVEGGSIHVRTGDGVICITQHSLPSTIREGEYFQ